MLQSTNQTINNGCGRLNLPDNPKRKVGGAYLTSNYFIQDDDNFVGPFLEYANIYPLLHFYTFFKSSNLNNSSDIYISNVPCTLYIPTVHKPT